MTLRAPSASRVGLALALLTAGCSITTGGELVDLQGSVVVAASPTWTTGDWVVALDRASLAVGPVYLFTERPNIDLGEWAHLAPLAAPPSAHAEDPFAAGRLVGELPHQVRVDLLAGGTVPLGAGTAIEGPVRSAEIWLEPAPDGPTLTLAGTASRATDTGTQVLPFRADVTWNADWVDVDDGRNEILLRRVRGLPLDATLDGPARLRIRLDPTTWLRGRDLDALPDLPPDAAGVRVLTPDDPVGRALDARVRRIASDGPWDLQLLPGE